MPSTPTPKARITLELALDAKDKLQFKLVEEDNLTQGEEDEFPERGSIGVLYDQFYTHLEGMLHNALRRVLNDLQRAGKLSLS